MAMRLGTFDVDSFLRDNWQKKPLLIRNPWMSWNNPLEPEELAGLAGENGIESRLITQGSRNWELEHGPLAESRFSRLRKKHWTLLVQAVDHYVPAVAALIEPFRFIPDWRIDDVMVSYAVEGGGVGPHFDQYDVFLVQGLGRRRWQIGGECDAATELLPHDDLRLLASFEPTDEWILDPGDILYVPPRVAHNGIAASDDCMTYSIGFRAPSRRELIAIWAESVIADLGDDDRYADPDLSARENPGEITPTAIDRLHSLITDRMLDRGEFSRCFARYSTTPKNPEIDWRPEEQSDPGEVRRLLAADVPLLRNPASRFSFIRETASVSLFVNGQCFACTGVAAAFAERLCAGARVMPSAEMIGSELALDLIVELLNQGSLAFDLED